MGIETKLTDADKLNYFGLATQFKIFAYVSIDYRGQRDTPNVDKWAIVSLGHCYNNTTNSWEFDSLPSERMEEFIATTRYPLHIAFEIVQSQQFLDYCKYTRRDHQ